jgi:hypothetical protein
VSTPCGNSLGELREVFVSQCVEDVLVAIIARDGNAAQSVEPNPLIGIVCEALAIGV